MEIFIDKLGMNGEGVARPLKESDLQNCTPNNASVSPINSMANNAEVCPTPKNNKKGNDVNPKNSLQKVTFVDFALPGERVEVNITEEKSKFCKAELVKVINPSEDRVVPPCPYFEKCGGCNLQHLKYEKQAEFKQNLVKETIFKVGGINAEVLPCVMSNPVGYRNKAVFPLGKNIGMFAHNSHNIVEIDKCLLMNDRINTAFNIVKTWIYKFNIKTFDFNTYKGILKYLVVRSVNNQTLVCLVTTSKEIPHLNELGQMLESVGNYGLYININNQKNSIILGNTYIHISGLDSISLNEFGIDYSVDVASFLQVNNEIKSKMYAEVMANVGGGMVIDAYAGAGLLSAVLSKSASKVFSVEIVPQASQKARKLVKLNDIKNMEVINGDCTKILPNLIKKVHNSNAFELKNLSATTSKYSVENAQNFVDNTTNILNQSNAEQDKTGHVDNNKGLDEELNLGGELNKATTAENLKNLSKCTVVLDPAHAGCTPEVIQAVKSADKIVYIACNPIALAKDLKVLQNTHKIIKIQPYDMFPQTRHVETLAILEKK